MPKEKAKAGPVFRHKLPEQRDFPYTYNASRSSQDSSKSSTKTSKIPRQNRPKKSRRSDAGTSSKVSFLSNDEPDDSAETSFSLPSMDETSQEIVAYATQLMNVKTLIPLDNYQQFCMQDFKKGKLQAQKFIFIRRIAKKFEDAYQWVYLCECSPYQVEYIKGLDTTILQSYKDVFKSDYKECGHTQALQYLLEKADEDFVDAKEVYGILQAEKEHGYSKDNLEHEITVKSIPGHYATVCVQAKDGSYGVVHTHFVKQSSKLVCQKCPKPSQSSEPCIHISIVQSFLLDSDGEVVRGIDEIRQQLQADPKYRDIRIPTSLSETKIPFIQHILPRNASFEEDNSGTCSCGLLWSDGTPHEYETLAYTSDSIKNVLVKTSKCSCGKGKVYDGSANDFLNMQTFLVGHDVLRDYMRHFLTEGCYQSTLQLLFSTNKYCLFLLMAARSEESLNPITNRFSTTMYNFHKMWCWKLQDHQKQPLLSYAKFRYSWYAFEKLLDIDYSDGYMCPSCGESPETVIMDGISLGFREVHLPPREMQDFSRVCFLMGSEHKSRVFLPDARARKLLFKFTDSGLEESEFEELHDLLEIVRSGLFPLFDYFKENTISKNCPDNYKRILKALSKNSPVCGYIHPSDELHNILEDVVSGENITCNADKMKVLHEQGPSLYKMISQSTEVSDEEKALITDSQ